MRKGEYNKEVLRLQQLLGRTLRLHAESELQIRFNAEREKVLCDLLLHQEFFEHIRALVAKHLGSDSAGSAAAGSDSGTTLQDLWQAGAAADASLTDTDPTWLHQQLPDSYVARLLRQASLQQVHQVFQMTRQDWVDFWMDTTQQLLLLQELCSRNMYDYRSPSEAAAASGSSSSSAEGAVLATASRAPPAAAPSTAQQQRLSVQQQALHTSAAANRELLWQTVDSKLQLIQLAWVLNPAPLLSVTHICPSANAQREPGREHWEAVADRLELSPMQEMHLSICVAECKRMQAAARSEGINLLQTAQQPSLQVAAALQQQQQQQRRDSELQHDQQQQQPQDVRGARRLRTVQGVQQGGAQEAMTGLQQASAVRLSDATPPTAFCQTPVAQQLQTHVVKRYMQLLCTQAFIVNTLTRHQLAVITVASFPYVPASFYVAEVVCSRRQQRTHEQLRELEKGASMKSNAALRISALDGQADASKLDSAAVDDDGSGHGRERVPYYHWLREQHDQERAAELLLHQHHCWSQLDRLANPQ